MAKGEQKIATNVAITHRVSKLCKNENAGIPPSWAPTVEAECNPGGNGWSIVGLPKAYVYDATNNLICSDFMDYQGSDMWKKTFSTVHTLPDHGKVEATYKLEIQLNDQEDFDYQC